MFVLWQMMNLFHAHTNKVPFKGKTKLPRTSDKLITCLLEMIQSFNGEFDKGKKSGRRNIEKVFIYTDIDS